MTTLPPRAAAGAGPPASAATSRASASATILAMLPPRTPARRPAFNARRSAPPSPPRPARVARVGRVVAVGPHELGPARQLLAARPVEVHRLDAERARRAAECP